MAETASKKKVTRLGDLVFSRTATFAGASILLTLAAVAFFLFIQAFPALLPGAEFDGKADDGPFAYVAPFVFGTLYGSIIALAIATPLAIGIALFISHFASRRLSQGLGYVVTCWLQFHRWSTASGEYWFLRLF